VQPRGDEPPADVTYLAQTRGFGTQLASRALANPLAVAGGALLVAAVLLGLMVLVGQGVDATGIGRRSVDTAGAIHAVLHFLALFLCFGMVGALGYGVRALARGRQSFHVFTGGFVHRRNGKCRAYAWPEVAELRPVFVQRGDDAGKLRCYRLVPRDGTAIMIPLVIVGGRDPFMDELMSVLDQNGVPVS
jgi:hypothetical protein